MDFAPADCLVIAHRGSWVRAPENSLLAIREAGALGVGMVEIDARQTADGAILVIHDDTLDRTTQSRGAVAEQDSATIRALRLRESGGGDDAPLTDERVPTLLEALEEARGHGLLVNVDTKSAAELPAVTREILRGGSAGDVVVKAELTPADLARLPADHSAFGPLPFMPVVKSQKGRFAEDLAHFARLKPFMIEAMPACVEDLEAGMEAARALGVRLWLNTLDVSHMTDFNDTAARQDADAIWGRLLDLGVGAIQTDESERLVAYLAARRLRSARL
ncbi:hypothetical protein NS365_10630 [Aureimonas ureilytica]|uniref:GP-PDE domain-containing protein n=1 Tax=Aureimonas ureilytica TaxID=401562 RepID=A0A175RR22_9HYPH|nr:hypothetical protein NS365_10630 [Aureimonas ureilytica]